MVKDQVWIKMTVDQASPENGTARKQDSMLHTSD